MTLLARVVLPAVADGWHKAVVVCYISTLAFTASQVVTCDTEFSALNHSISRVLCPANCWKQHSTLCGDGEYSRGPICLAAMKEQLIDASGGPVDVYRSPSRSRYARGSVRNGIESKSCPAGKISYSFKMTCATTGDSGSDVTEVDCPANCRGSSYSCGKRGFFTNSSVCAAAARAGKLNIDAGGLVKFYRQTGRTLPTSGNMTSGSSCLSGEPWFTFQDLNDCPSKPCHHGGTCVDIIGGYKCACAPDTYGLQCEQNCPSVTYTFPRHKQIKDYIWYQPTVPSLVMATICFWIRSDYLQQNTVVSYASGAGNNDIFLIFGPPNKVFLSVGNVVKSFTVRNHSSYNTHTCVWFDTHAHTCGMFVNGTQVYQGKHGGKRTRAGGSLLFGQEQDKRNAGGLSALGALTGTLSNLFIWPRVLRASEVQGIHSSCVCPQDYSTALTPDTVKLYGEVTAQRLQSCPI